MTRSYRRAVRPVKPEGTVQNALGGAKDALRDVAGQASDVAGQAYD